MVTKATKRVFKWWHPTAGFGLMAIIVSVVRMRSCGESENGMRDTTPNETSLVSVLIGKLMAWAHVKKIEIRVIFFFGTWDLR